jgi:hypothetical protein
MEIPGQFPVEIDKESTWATPFVFLPRQSEPFPDRGCRPRHGSDPDSRTNRKRNPSFLFTCGGQVLVSKRRYRVVRCFVSKAVGTWLFASSNFPHQSSGAIAPYIVEFFTHQACALLLNDETAVHVAGNGPSDPTRWMARKMKRLQMSLSLRVLLSIPPGITRARSVLMAWKYTGCT